jgi:predicted AlkP superfamily phosphohydrolase/phosphomutase
VKHPRVFIIGLDSATWDLLRPWAAEGRLPNLARLTKEGVSGTLKSAIPPLTPPAWTSFMTGKNPGKHGLYHFIEPRPGGYELRYTNARSRMARTVWQIMGESNLKVGVINVPMTYPPEPVSGYMISGMDAPAGSTSITHPPELFAELAQHFDRVSKQVRYLGYLKTDERRDAVLQALDEADQHYLRLTTYLLERHPVDVAMIVFTSTDTVQHFFFPAIYLLSKRSQCRPALVRHIQWERLERAAAGNSPRLQRHQPDHVAVTFRCGL